MPHSGSRSGERPGASGVAFVCAPIVRASVSAETLATWWSPKATCMSTWCGGVPGSGSVVMCSA